MKPSRQTEYSKMRPATERQRFFMQENGIEFDPKYCTVAEATELITDYLNDPMREDRHPMDFS